jgi:hypothetical protein
MALSASIEYNQLPRTCMPKLLSWVVGDDIITYSRMSMG